MKRILLALALQTMSATLLNAQFIKGSVKDEKGNLVNDATVSLLNTKDSSVVKLALSNEGAYSFDQVKRDSFLISISHVGYKTIYSQKFALKGEPITIPAMVLNEPIKLQGVTVLARKKMIEVKPDKTVLNVEGTINSTGGDALDLLRKSPGVSVDNDEKLSVNGKNGVQVYIDNKPTPLNGQDLSSYLKSIPAAQIEAIEIIQNPGVMYEASGSGGIINIRLKKNKSVGFNASINAGISASKNTRADNGFSINYRNKRMNAFGSYNVSDRPSPSC